MADPLFPGGSGDPLFPGGTPGQATAAGNTLLDFTGATSGQTDTSQLDFTGGQGTAKLANSLDFGGATPGQASALDFGAGAPAPKSPSLLGRVGGVLRGIGGIGGEVAKEATQIPYQLGESVIDKVAGTRLAPSSQFNAANPDLAGKGLLPSQAEWTNELNKMPIAGGILRGFQQTGEEIRHPSRVAKNYSANPIGAALSDIGTIASILPGVGEAIHGVTVGGQTTDAALMAARAGEGSVAAARAAKVGDIIKAIGEAPTLSTVIRGSRAGLTSLADRLTSSPELLHAVDDSVSQIATQTPTAVSKGLEGAVPPQIQAQADALRAAIQAGQVPADQLGRAQQLLDQVDQMSKAGPAEPEALSPQLDQAGTAAQQADRDAQIKARAGKGGFTKALGEIGTRMRPETQNAVNAAVDGMNRIKSVQADKTLTIEDAAKAKQAISNATAQKLLNNPSVERINEIDRAGLEAAAKEAHQALPDYLRKLGFTDLGSATNGRFAYPNAYVPNEVAAQLQRITAHQGDLGLAGATLQGASKFTQLSRLALNPLAPLGRLGHAVLAVADNPNIKESFRLAAKDVLSKVKIGEGLSTADLEELSQGTTMARHGAVWEASARAESEDPSRVRAIANSIANAPTNILAKSPFLRMARAMDDSMRSGIWLAARHAGATREEADYLLGRTAGYFDRSTPVQRQISKAIPFYNWHKQSLLILSHMAEDNPAAFAQFTEAASNMTRYNEQQGIQGSNTRLGNKDVSLSFLNPFSSFAADLAPQTLLSSPLKAAYPILTGVGVSQNPTSTPTGPLKGGGAQQVPAAIQELIKTTPQLQALINGSQPRYGTGQPVAGAHGGGALQTWSSLLGVPTQDSSVTQATNLSIAASKAKQDKARAAAQRSYQKKLAANGQG